MNKINSQLIDQLETQIRSGELALVKATLEKLQYENIPRPFIVKLAVVSRRVGYNRNALRLLNPIVRPQKPVHPPASQEELVEYAIILTRIGVTNEALKILDTVKNQITYEAIFSKITCLMTSWDYAKVIPLLNEYLKTPGLTPYQKLVIQMNLASSYIQELQYANAEQILTEIITSAKAQEHKLILGFAHLTHGELCVIQRDTKTAAPHLTLARELLQDSHYRYAVYIKQWQALSELITTNGSLAAKKELAAVKAEAAKKKLWEVVRECDLHEALVTEDEKTLIRIYFGTPYAAFRERILKLYKNKLQLPSHYIWPLKQTHKMTHRLFDVVQGGDRNARAQLRKGQLPHQLLQVLASDFYRPFKVEVLFSHLFAGENYDLTRSAAKVYDVIGRLRAWFKENKIPLAILNSSRNEFKLEATAPYSLSLKTFDSVNSMEDLFAEKLKLSFPEKWFSIKMVMLEMGLSRATCKRYLRDCLDKQVLQASGNIRSRKYKIAG